MSPLDWFGSEAATLKLKAWGVGEAGLYEVAGRLQSPDEVPTLLRGIEAFAIRSPAPMEAARLLRWIGGDLAEPPRVSRRMRRYLQRRQARSPEARLLLCAAAAAYAAGEVSKNLN